MKYAVTAATGHFGQIAVNTLNQLVGAENVTAIARNEDKAKQLFPNNTVRKGDYAEQQSMVEALAGMDKVLFISSQPGGPVDRLTQHKNVVEALQKDNVKFVAYTSFPHAQESSSALAADHRETEKAIKVAGLQHAFLRNNWYLENEIGFLKSGAAGQDALYWANHQAGWSLESNYAEAAAKSLTVDAPQDVYELAGASHSYAELGAALKEAVNKDFAVKQVSEQEYVDYLVSTGLDQDTAALFASFQAPINDGSLEENTSDLEKLLGHSVAPLAEQIKTVLD